ARAVAPYRHRNDLTFPTRPHHGPPPVPIVWVEPTAKVVLNILNNPAYAGAYVWGKSTTDPARRKPSVAHSGVVRRPLEEWSVGLFDIYPASITWEQFRTTQQRLRANQYRYRAGPPGAARIGEALLHPTLTAPGTSERRGEEQLWGISRSYGFWLSIHPLKCL